MIIKVQLSNGTWVDMPVPHCFETWHPSNHWQWLDVLCHALGGWQAWLTAEEFDSLFSP